MSGRVALVVVAMLNACHNDTAEPAVRLTESGACGEAYFWAASSSGDIAVTVFAEVRDRSKTDRTTIRFSVADADVEVKVLRGHKLIRNFCTDLPDLASRPTSERAAKRGNGRMVVAPPGNGVDPPAGAPIGGEGCGVAGSVAIDGLVGPDGTRFAPVRISANTIGCYAG